MCVVQISSLKLPTDWTKHISLEVLLIGVTHVWGPYRDSCKNIYLDSYVDDQMWSCWVAAGTSEQWIRARRPEWSQDHSSSQMRFPEGWLSPLFGLNDRPNFKTKSRLLIPATKNNLPSIWSRCSGLLPSTLLLLFNPLLRSHPSADQDVAYRTTSTSKTSIKRVRPWVYAEKRVNDTRLS